MKIIAIEGGIGSGKTTLLDPLVSYLNKTSGKEWSLIVEPVDEDPEFHRLLKQFINHPHDANKRAEFQMYITRCRHRLLQGIPDGNYIIERSLYSDIVFTQCNMFSTEQASGEYQSAYYDIKQHFNTYPKIDLVIYLNRNPLDCFNSAKQRDRDGESSYQLAYFEDLHLFHQACLPQLCREHGAIYYD
uniref:deoxynucleoside kinase n=1 Tax=uncultured Cetobacterium sp. TaxID=527638 RepID=UPI0026049F05